MTKGKPQKTVFARPHQGSDTSIRAAEGYIGRLNGQVGLGDGHGDGCFFSGAQFKSRWKDAHGRKGGPHLALQVQGIQQQGVVAFLGLQKLQLLLHIVGNETQCSFSVRVASTDRTDRSLEKRLPIQKNLQVGLIPGTCIVFKAETVGVAYDKIVQSLGKRTDTVDESHIFGFG